RCYRDWSSDVCSSDLDARLEIAGDLAHQFLPEVAPDHVAAERERQPGFLVPPLAHVHPKAQTSVAVSQLAFVNEEAGLRLAGQRSEERRVGKEWRSRR